MNTRARLLFTEMHNTELHKHRERALFEARQILATARFRAEILFRSILKLQLI